MKIYNAKFTDAELNSVFDEYSENADFYLNDESRMSGLFAAVKGLLCKISKVPVIGKYADDIIDIISMISDYRSGFYTAVPKKTIIAMIAVLLYLSTPVDLIPDIIPVLGWVDDAAVIAFAYRKGLKKDIEAYREWKELNIIAGSQTIEIE